MNALLRWYYTLRPLKAVQWWHLLARPIRISFSQPRKANTEDIAIALNRQPLYLMPLHVARSYDPGARSFTFLNRTKTFADDIDWNGSGESLLWTYNLAYFEWLYDDALSIDDRLVTIRSFTNSNTSHKIATDAYPISLRIVSWIRFLLRFDIKDERIIRRLFSDAEWLYRFPEYHLQGNHLWENALALLCAGGYFCNKRFYERGARLLNKCIEEQVLSDGGHVEGSLMYHSLLLWRTLQCIELLEGLSGKDTAQNKTMRETAARMLGWLKTLTFSDGSWPMFNDCTPGIAPPTQELLRYARHLSITPQDVSLSDSGYRMIRFGDFELAVDVAPIQPVWQPGHSHADITTFCLNYKGQPVIVDTGTSTYEISQRRSWERSTAAHNTLAVGGKNSSDVWKSFRVGRRAKIISIVEKDGSLAVAYRPSGCPEIVHRRSFSWNDNCLEITDLLEGGEVLDATAALHFQPGVEVKQVADGVLHAGNLEIRIIGIETKAELRSHEFAAGFNERRTGVRAGFRVKKHLITTIENV